MLANRAVLGLSVGLFVGLAVLYGLTRWQYGRRWAKSSGLDGRDRRYHREVAALGIGLALVGGFFWRPLFNGGYSMPNGGGDLVSFFYPIHVWAAQRLHAGELPLWNPNLFSGMPFAADIQSGVFYPVNWLFWLLGYPITYEKVEALALVHYWLALSFTYALGRSLGLGRWPSLLAGTIYAFSGFAVSHLGHLPMLAAATWLPLVLMAVNRAARPHRRRATGWRWAVAVGLLLAIDFLAGHFQLFLYTFYAAAIFWAAIAWRGRRVEPSDDGGSGQWRWLRGYWSGQVLRGGLALLVMGLATAVQVGPFLEMGQLSVRSSISYETSTQFGVWPTGLIELILPNLFTPNPQAYFGPWSNTDVLGYVGLLSFGLAGLGILLKPVGRSAFYPVFFVTMAVAGLIFGLSGYTIFQGWFYEFVPALNLTRGAGRFLVLFDLGIAVGAAFGLQNYLDYRARPREADNERLLKWGWRAYALVGLAVVVLPLPILYSQIMATPGQINDLLVRGTDGLGLVVVLAGLGATLWRLLTRRSLGPDLAAGLTLALVVFDLFSVRSGFNVQAGNVANGFSHDETAAFLRSHDLTGQYRLDDSVGTVGQAWQPNTAQLYGLYDLRGVFNPLQLASYETLWNAITSSQKDFRAVPVYNALGARFVLARNKEDPTGPQFKLAYQDSRPGVKINVWENEQSLPRAWLLHHTELKPTDGTLPALLSPDFKPGQTAYLAAGRTLTGPTDLPANESIKLTGQSANHLELSITAASEGYVVINQNFYPGWRATLDGNDALIERADYTFQAVYVGAGRHRLSLDFTPTLFWPLLAVSVTTWLLGLGWLGLGLARRPVRDLNNRRAYEVSKSTPND